jgi:hypothetical protein
MACGVRLVSVTEADEPTTEDVVEDAPAAEAEPIDEPAPAQESRSRFTEEEEPVSPIFERRSTRSRDTADTGYESRSSRASSATQQPRRAPRVYQEDGVSEPQRTQTRRGFTPDVPSFMRKKQS